MWVKFTAPFNWHPPERGGAVTVRYPADLVAFVRRACGAAAIAAGKATAAERPGR